jgi:hypothetical protein
VPFAESFGNFLVADNRDPIHIVPSSHISIQALSLEAPEAYKSRAFPEQFSEEGRRRCRCSWHSKITQRSRRSLHPEVRCDSTVSIKVWRHNPVVAT